MFNEATKYILIEGVKFQCKLVGFIILVGFMKHIFMYLLSLMLGVLPHIVVVCISLYCIIVFSTICAYMIYHLLENFSYIIMNYEEKRGEI